MENFVSLEPQFLSIFKVVILVGILLYIVFAAVLVRQVNIMTETLELGHERVIKYLSVAHLILTVGLFILALVLL